MTGKEKAANSFPSMRVGSGNSKQASGWVSISKTHGLDPSAPDHAIGQTQLVRTMAVPRWSRHHPLNRPISQPPLWCRRCCDGLQKAGHNC